MAKLRSSVNYERGAVRLEYVLVFVLLLGLFGIFLLRLQELQRDMEQVVVDAETMSLRTSLQMAVASKVVRGEESALAEWAGRNPLILLEREASGMPPTVSAGGASLSKSWRWHQEHQALEYEYSGGGVLRLKLARMPLTGRDGWALGAGLFLVRERPDAN